MKLIRNENFSQLKIIIIMSVLYFYFRIFQYLVSYFLLIHLNLSNFLDYQRLKKTLPN